MFQLIKILGLISKTVALQFAHFFGYVAFAASFAVGYFRLPSWTAIPAGFVLSFAANYVSDVSDVRAMLATVPMSDNSGRMLDQGAGGFLMLAYLAIAIVGYIVGGWSRIQVEKRKLAAGSK